MSALAFLLMTNPEFRAPQTKLLFATIALGAARASPSGEPPGRSPTHAQSRLQQVIAEDELPAVCTLVNKIIASFRGHWMWSTEAGRGGHRQGTDSRRQPFPTSYVPSVPRCPPANGHTDARSKSFDFAQTVSTL
jgi:hypothetical protein